MPTQHFIRVLSAARLAADVLDIPALIVARTDALSATLLTSDIDPRDREFCTGERTPEGYFRVRDGAQPVIVRALAYAPYADLLWFETSKPDLTEARANHLAYTLPGNNAVLLMGGTGGDGALSSTELYTPSWQTSGPGSFAKSAPMNSASLR